ncbi:glycosyltransferase family 4 protein [Geothrix campi]|uniref:glycosyltransferase family 4 protein n=1 Tax=Geothrix campi TaxID=2966450 RepID=UPI0021488211|nr:glycosyltransferase family 4 protein [Geothrix sp. SG10]
MVQTGITASDKVAHTLKTISYFANSDWYLFNFRAPLAQAAKQTFGAEIHCLCPDGPYRPRLEAMGFRWFETPLERQGTDPIAEWKLLQRVRQVLHETRPDLLHNFTLKSVVWGTRAARAEGIPALVNALAGMGSVFRGDTMKGALIRPVIKGLLRRSLSGHRQRVIFQNPDDLQLAVKELGVDPCTAALIRGSGVNTARFTPALISPDPPVALFVGRLLKDKGILTFISAAEQLHKTHPSLRFRIAGSADAGNPSSLQISDIKKISSERPYLEFLGHVEDMVQIYRGASFMVLPTAYGEGVPRSLIEAAACGLPLIATDHPGCREIVLDGVNGFTVQPKDSQALADAIRKLLKNSDQMITMGVQGRTLVETEFSEESVIKRTLQIYRDLMVG